MKSLLFAILVKKKKKDLALKMLTINSLADDND
jgi:hypothetical protein